MPVASDMIERVARAICDVHADQLGEHRHLVEPFQSNYRAMAAATIKAMREPTDDMLAIGNDIVFSNCEKMKVAWQAMIDEALVMEK